MDTWAPPFPSSFLPSHSGMPSASKNQQPMCQEPSPGAAGAGGPMPELAAPCAPHPASHQWALCGQPGTEGTRGGTSWGTLWGTWDRSGGGQPCSSFPQCVLARSVPPVVTGTRGRDFNIPDANFFVALGSKSCMLGTCGPPNLKPSLFLPPGAPRVSPSVPARPCAPRGAAPTGCPLCPSREVSHLPNP